MENTENKSRCVGGIEHKFQYVTTLEGKSIYACWTCGNVEFQFEESHGG